MMKSGDFNPHFFDYGGLTLYLQLGVACVTFILGAMSGLFGSLAQFGSADLVIPARIRDGVDSACSRY